ncbi:MAG: hypothetical protein QOJ91_2568 [Sphingomonadales bacterium]|jgi:hypothetical protein|nr:hypothetical protein [Sphingomonadales bacterium]
MRDVGSDQLELPIPTSAIPFTAHRIEGTTTLWSDADASAAVGLQNPEQIAEKFSYGIIGSPTFGGLRFDPADSVMLHAERYGGGGIGAHGGGARVGNLGPFQLKGIGRNLLAGDPGDSLDGQFHSYGGFALADGIAEIVTSAVANAILPYGAVKCLALIAIGPEAAFYPQRWDTVPSPGVILVRERCLRPAHFLPNRNFAIGADFLLRYGGDADRVRRACRALYESQGSHVAVVELFTTFMDRCAVQFAHAYLHRINHGTLSASNIAVDGRWLDTNWLCLLPSGVDHQQHSGTFPFSSESEFPKEVIVEWAYNYSKYMNVAIDERRLLANYERRFQAALASSTRSFFGLTNEASDGRGSGVMAHALVVEAEHSVSSSLSLTSHISAAGPERADPSLRLIEAVFRISGEGTADPELYGHLKTALAASSQAEGQAKRSPGEAERRALLRAVRRIAYAGFFYRDRIVGQSSALALDFCPNRLAPLVDKWAGIARLAFGDEAGEQVVLKHGGVSVLHREDDSLLVGVDEDQIVLTGSERYRKAVEILNALPATRCLDEACYGYPAAPAFDLRAGAILILDALDRHQQVENAL